MATKLGETKQLIHKFEATLLEKQLMIQQYQNDQNEIIKQLGALKQDYEMNAVYNADHSSVGSSSIHNLLEEDSTSYKSPSFPHDCLKMQYSKDNHQATYEDDNMSSLNSKPTHISNYLLKNG